jgi:hypothetical protein
MYLSGTSNRIQPRVGLTDTDQTHNTLIVDISPKNTSTAAAAGNITRCVLSAAAVAAMQPLLEAMGRGLFFTALAAFSGVLSMAATILLRHKGMIWRNERHMHEEKKALKKSEK